MGAPSNLQNSDMDNNNNNNNSNSNTLSNNNGLPESSSLSSGLSQAPDKASSSSSTPLQTYISLIQQYLAVFLIDNALFLAERCVADFPSSSDAVYLLALCHYRLQSPKAARLILDRATAPRNTSIEYLSALCSYDLEDYVRAEEALLKQCRQTYKQQQQQSSSSSSSLWNSTNHNSTTTNRNAMDNSNGMTMDEFILTTTPCPIPNGAAGIAFLGRIARKSNRPKRAIQYFRMSLQLDPFLWTSMEALAELGVQDAGVSALAHHHLPPNKAPTVLGALATTTTKTPLQPSTTAGLDLESTPIPSKSSMRAGLSQQPSSAVNSVPTVSRLQNRSVRFDTPGLTPIPANTSHSYLHHPTYVVETPVPTHHHHHTSSSVSRSVVDQPHLLRRASQVATRQYYPPSPETPMATITKSMRYLRGLGLNSSSSTLNEEGFGTSRHLFSSTENQLSSSNNRQVPLTQPNSNSNNNVGGGNNGTSGSSHGGGDGLDKLTSDKEPPPPKVQEILELLVSCAVAYQHICQYKCKEALKALQTNLPAKQQTTGWALYLKGRAHLELNEFAAAQRALELMQIRDPTRVKGLELLSTVYWHQKKEVELSHLAQQVVAWNRFAPETWCVVGNCFSLQKDHETALVFFGRSLQLDPDFTYTHTLSGYEYMANEDFDKAILCFRQALRTNDRHYNAWYGLGAIYHRQEKFDMAEYHFERAVQFHPTNSILLCNLGMAQYANGKAYQALETLSQAFSLDPSNPQARFQRATIYSALHRPHEALQELLIVRDAAPREATIHFALGKVWKKLGNPEQAMKCFLTAMDLDPKDNQMIKSAMEKLNEQTNDSSLAEEEEEEMAVF